MCIYVNLNPRCLVYDTFRKRLKRHGAKKLVCVGGSPRVMNLTFFHNVGLFGFKARDIWRVMDLWLQCRCTSRARTAVKGLGTLPTRASATGPRSNYQSTIW